MATTITDLASAISDDQPVATFRISTVTALEGVTPFRLKTVATDTAWLARDAETSFAVGDTVYILQQGSTFFVAGKIGGAAATPIGSLTAFAGATAPNGWMTCDGSAISRTTYAALFGLVGTAYGVGNGTTTFNIPDLRGRTVMGPSATHVITSTGGADTTTLSTGQLPAHDHGSAGNHAHGITNIGGVFVTAGGAAIALASSSGAVYITDAGGAHTHNSVGSGSSVPILSPFIALPYIIRVL